MSNDNAAPTESIADDPEFLRLLGHAQGWSDGKPVLALGLQGAASNKLIAHIDRHTREAVRAALEEAARSIDQIDDGEAPAYRHCQEHIRTLATKKEQANG